jgi:hypothetical protein
MPPLEISYVSHVYIYIYMYNINYMIRNCQRESAECMEWPPARMSNLQFLRAWAGHVLYHNTSSRSIGNLPSAENVFFVKY